MVAHLHTFSKTSAFGALPPAGVAVRDRIAASRNGGTAELSMYGRNAADVHALVARCLR